jgi:hypothetical protein
MRILLYHLNKNIPKKLIKKIKKVSKMISLFFFGVSCVQIVVGIDVGVTKFRVAVPNSSKTFFYLSPLNSNTDYFPTTLEIKSKDGQEIPKVISPKDAKKFDYKWIDENEPITKPNSTIVHPTHFIAKLSSPAFIQQCFKRKYYHTSSLYRNSFHMTSGLLPQVVTSLVLKRIAHTITESGGELQRTIIAVPKFWVQAQREAIYYPAKKLNMNPIIIDSSTAICFYIARKYKSLLEDHPHRILAIDIGETYAQAIVYEYGRDKNIFGVEKIYRWTDKVGGRDFDVCIADLIQKQTKTSFEPLIEVKRMRVAEKVKRYLLKSDEVSGEFEGVPFAITRKMVEAATIKHLQTINNMIFDIFNYVQNIEIDIVELVGGSSKFFAVQNLVRMIFGVNRIHISKHPEEAISSGTAFLLSQEINCEALGLYNIEVMQGNNKKGFEMNSKLENGSVTVSISSDCVIPTGAPEIILWGNASTSTTIYKNPSNIIKLKNPLNIVQIPWLAGTMQLTDIIHGEFFMKFRIQYALDLFRYKIGNFTQEIEDNEVLDEVISIDEKTEIIDEFMELLKWYKEKAYSGITLDDLVVAERRLNNTIFNPILKKENRLLLDASIEKMKLKILKIHDDIKGMADLIGNNLTNESVELIMKPVVQATNWIDEKAMKQKLLNSYRMPVLWWFEIERKVSALDAVYKQLSKKFVNQLKEKEGKPV